MALSHKHIEPKIAANIKVYILTKSELLCSLCYEIPCNSHNSTTVNPISAEEDYERQFFILRMIVLGTIGCVFSILGLIFWVYFVYLWKTWDSGKQKCIQISGMYIFYGKFLLHTFGSRQCSNFT